MTEAGTGEPLAGVNVVLDGTTQGTTTDPDGNYVLLNVRPDTYTLVFSFIGFRTTRVEDVRATTGQTTRIDAQMREEYWMPVTPDGPIETIERLASAMTIGVLTFRWIVNRMPILFEHPKYRDSH